MATGSSLAAREPRSVGVVVTTYNWPAALELVLRGLLRQSRLPDEILVADDGSGESTRALVARLAATSAVPLQHAWQPDRGFRAGRVRNLAIARCRSEYVLLLDGDMVPHRHWLADHLAAARPGCFVQGSRVLSTPEGADRLLAERCIDVRWRDAGMRRRRHTLRLPWLSRLLQAATHGRRLAGTKTCNQGWWRADLHALNGFDERLQGWGREDAELAARAFHAGLMRRSLRFAGLAVHLWHAQRHANGASANDRFLQDTLAVRRSRAVVGLDGHAPHAVPLGAPEGCLAQVAAAPLCSEFAEWHHAALHQVQSRPPQERASA